MSQSNKRKYVILTVILFILVVVYCVAFAMYYTSKNESSKQSEENVLTTEETNVEEKTEEVEDVAELEEVDGVEKYSTYTENALTISSVTLDTEGFVTYEQIAGLKDDEFQDSINEEVKNLAQEYYNKYKDDEQCYFHASVCANYGNVLSICVNYYAEKKDTRIGLNYNLATGEKLTLKELFTSESAGVSCIRQEAYNDWLWNYVSSEGEEYADGGYLEVDNYEELEEEVLNIIYDYKKGKLTNFWFTTTGIYIDNVRYIDISMSSYAEYIGIYSRYADIDAETIYEDTSIARTGLYCMTMRADSVYEILEENDNYYIDLSVISWASTDLPEEVINKVKQVVDEKYQEIQDTELEDDEFYIANMIVYIHDDSQDDDEGTIYDISAHYYTWSTTTELWNNEVKDTLFEYWYQSIETLTEEINTNYMDNILESNTNITSRISEDDMEICTIDADGNEIED